MTDKRYRWLKLPDDFFDSKAMKKLRRLGEVYALIYLEMLLASVKSEGRLLLEGYEDTTAEEIALEIDEDADDVTVVLQFLEKSGLLEEVSACELYLTQMDDMLGAESDSAKRVRAYREKKKSDCNCNGDVTDCNVTCNGDVTDCNVTCNGDVTQRKSKRREEKEIEGESARATLPEIEAYCEKINARISAKSFYDYYSANGWMVGKSPMVDWRAAVRRWNENGYVQKGTFPERPTEDHDALMARLASKKGNLI